MTNDPGNFIIEIIKIISNPKSPFFYVILQLFALIFVIYAIFCMVAYGKSLDSFLWKLFSFYIIFGILVIFFSIYFQANKNKPSAYLITSFNFLLVFLVMWQIVETNALSYIEDYSSQQSRYINGIAPAVLLVLSVLGFLMGIQAINTENDRPT